MAQEVKPRIVRIVRFGWSMIRTDFVSIRVILMEKFGVNLKCITRKAIGRDAAALSCGYCGADTDPVGASEGLQKSSVSITRAN
jgi:hypothetical protein